MTKRIKMLVAFWGILDLCCVAWYIVENIYQCHIPIYSDIAKSVQETRILGHPSRVIIFYLWIPIFLSLVVSGILLIKQRLSGVIIAYVQTFFRLIAFIPPSMFFILWFSKYIFDKPPAILGFLLVLISESLKLWTVISLHKSILRQKAIS